MKRIRAGDIVRVRQDPPPVDRDMPDEIRELFRRCVGNVFRVERIDAHEGLRLLELLVLDDGAQAPDHCHHTIFIEPEYVELVSAGSEKL